MASAATCGGQGTGSNRCPILRATPKPNPSGNLRPSRGRDGTKGNMPTPDSIAAELTVPERVLLFCLASDTDWQAVSITHATAQYMMVRRLIERDRAATRSALTEQGRTVLAVLLAKGGR
jgi:hypothetical protein